MEMSKKGRTPLRVEVTVDESIERVPQLRAYLFDSAGRVAESAPVSEQLTFQIDPSQRYRVTVGPDLVAGEHVPADVAARLVKSSALSQDVRPLLPVDAVRFAVSPSL